MNEQQANSGTLPTSISEEANSSSFFGRVIRRDTLETVYRSRSAEKEVLDRTVVG